jgi:hypothetical protein
MLLDDRFIIVPVFLLLYRRRTRAQLDARVVKKQSVPFQNVSWRTFNFHFPFLLVLIMLQD